MKATGFMLSERQRLIKEKKQHVTACYKAQYKEINCSLSVESGCDQEILSSRLFQQQDITFFY